MSTRQSNYGLSIFLLTILTWLPASSYADLCENLGNGSPYMYKLYCSESEGKKGEKKTASKPAGSSTTFSDSFKLNAASLPTQNSPYGIEILGTVFDFNTKPGYIFGLVKGFSRFGTGLSTSTSNTFYSNDIVQRLNLPSKRKNLDPYEEERGYVANVNLGTSFLLFEIEEGPSVALGLSGRYNKTTNTIGGGPAILIAGSYFGLGFGVSEEKYSNLYARTRFYTAQASLRFLEFELEVTSLFEYSQPTLKPITIVTLNHGIGDFFITGAMRSINYLSEGDIVQFHSAVQYMVSSHVSLGYLYNYIPGGHTLGLQLIL